MLAWYFLSRTNMNLNGLRIFCLETRPSCPPLQRITAPRFRASREAEAEGFYLATAETAETAGAENFLLVSLGITARSDRCKTAEAGSQTAETAKVRPESREELSCRSLKLTLIAGIVGRQWGADCSNRFSPWPPGWAIVSFASRLALPIVAAGSRRLQQLPMLHLRLIMVGLRPIFAADTV